MKVGVIGLGAMGINHVRVYRDIGATIVAAADPDPVRGRLVRERYGIDWLPNFTELISNRDVEAISVAVPTTLHYEVARAALLAGKHVLVEKPMADTIAKARELHTIAEENDLVLAVGHIERHNPAVHAARSLIESGEAGDVLTLTSRRVSEGGGRIQDVGVIMDLAIHDVDVARYLVQDEVSAVYAVAGNAPGSESREDRAQILLEFRSGVFGTLEASWRSPIKVRSLSLTCSRKHIELDYIGQSIESATSEVADPASLNIYSVPRRFERHTVALVNQEPLANELRNFLNACEGRTRPLVGAIDGIKALEIAQAALRAAKMHERIELRDG